MGDIAILSGKYVNLYAYLGSISSRNNACRWIKNQSTHKRIDDLLRACLFAGAVHAVERHSIQRLAHPVSRSLISLIRREVKRRGRSRICVKLQRRGFTAENKKQTNGGVQADRGTGVKWGLGAIIACHNVSEGDSRTISSTSLLLARVGSAGPCSR